METKKIMLPTIIAIVFLILITVGATYAYFRVQANNISSTASINASIASIGSITVTNVSPNISINVTATDMIDAGVDVPYYAQAGNNQSATTTVTSPTVANINVVGAGTYRCNYTLTLNATTSGTNTYTAFQNMASKSAGQIVLTINTEKTTVLDFNDVISFPTTISGAFTGLTQSRGASITAQLKIVNKTGINQNALAGSDISISIQPTRFDCEIIGEPIDLVANSVQGLSTELVAGLYRYQGTTADNYICFGTTDKATCTGNTNKYMYRIIGIDANGQMKLIKSTLLGTHNWSSSTNKTWPESTLYSDLNGSPFLTNTTYVPSGWSGRIAETDWHYWTGTNGNVTAESMASSELGAATVNAKIGLMYIHDYEYALPGGNNCYTSGATCKTSWIFLSSEWLISRGNTSGAWRLNTDGTMGNFIMTNLNSVRPVFYLNTDQIIYKGSGTLSDPYILW